MTTTLDTLLISTLPDPLHKTVRVPRLVMADGTPLTLELQQLTFNQIADLRERHKDFAVHTVLAGVKSPSLRDSALREHFDVETPVDLIKKLFLPGKIDAPCTHISKLSGYDKKTVELVQEIKKTDNGR